MRPDDAHRQQAADLRRKREVVMEEALRAATALMAVVFAGGLLTALPFVPVWMFGAALAGVALSLPAGVAVRLGGLRGNDDPHQARWFRSFIGVTVAATLGALLLALTGVTGLETALWRLAGVLAVLGAIALLRGRVFPDPDAEHGQRTHGDR